MGTIEVLPGQPNKLLPAVRSRGRSNTLACKLALLAVERTCSQAKRYSWFLHDMQTAISIMLLAESAILCSSGKNRRQVN